MKRLFYLILIIGIPLIVFFQYDRYRRFHPPTTYEYQVSDSIDYQYHDPSIITEFFESAEQCGTYARYVWRKHRVDVKADDKNNPKAQAFISNYQQLLAKTAMLEGKLKQSLSLKAQGFGNEEIKAIELHGDKPEHLIYKEYLGSSPFIQYGDEGAQVLVMQKLLHKKGHQIKIDGIFDQETLRAVQSFQEASGLVPNGIVDQWNIEKLLK